MVERDQRIDIVRGLAIVTLLVNHLNGAIVPYGLQGPLIPTPTQYGYSSAATLFVALSGYMVGKVYLRRPDPVRTVLTRAWEIYAANLILFVVMVPLAFTAGPRAIATWSFGPMVTHPGKALFDFATFAYAPCITDVLQLYVVLMLAAPAAIMITRRSPWLMAGLSIGLYAFAQLLSFTRPDLWTGDNIMHSFNPLAWQIGFFIPMLFGRIKLHRKLFDWFEGHPERTLPILAALATCALARRGHWVDGLSCAEALTSKGQLGMLRVVHGTLLICAYAGLLTGLKRLLGRRPFRILSLVGRNTLGCFVTSVPLTYILSELWQNAHAGYFGYLLAMAVLFGSILPGAKLFEQWRQRPEPNGNVLAARIAQPVTV